jgi:hypothetical protein
MMYRARWEIDIAAGDPKKAARAALAIQRDRQSTATVFDVTKMKGKTVRVDLGQPGTTLTCDNCSRHYRSVKSLKRVYPDIPDLLQRLDPGGVVPAGECPTCGALVYRG